MKTPESMEKELGTWNSGKGISLDLWIQCEGNFSLAVGYLTIFCPKIVEFENYIFLANDGIDENEKKQIKKFESREGVTPKDVECLKNHVHIANLHHRGCEDLTLDKILLIGNMLKEIYESRLNHLFPEKPCVVEFYKPENPYDLQDYQISFWQRMYD